MGSSGHVSLIILGAGRPFRGEGHAALRAVPGRARVLDWMLDAMDARQDEVHFVGGCLIEAVKERFPGFSYSINEEWETSRAAYSMLKAPLPTIDDCMVSYADILYRKGLARQLNAVDADIVVAVDSHWRERFSGRTQEDVRRCEKVSIEAGWVTSLGAGIAAEHATAEFVGCVLFRRSALAMLDINKVGLASLVRNFNLSELIDILRMRGLLVKAVDVFGDWAELNEPNDLAHFVLGTKAQTLARMRNMVKRSRIEDQLSFTVAEWLTDPSGLVAAIQKLFNESALVVRSSTVSEDGFASSSAGAYVSRLNVSRLIVADIRAAINAVIASYPDSNPANQVLVQPMLANVLASGVVLTRCLGNGAPYYVANFDDVTGDTASITSGSSREHQTLVMRRDVDESHPSIPAGMKVLLPGVREIEELLGYDSLDIEFAITAENGLHVLQVRPIAVDHSEHSSTDDEVLKLTEAAEADFAAAQHAVLPIVGQRALFGIMPDWNPAEIIGTKPGNLACSLYRFLITDEVWATQRAEYGYRDVRPQRLLRSFAEHPYVDIRASFNSFVPATIDDGLAGRLVDFYLDWLERHPHLHDKVEFDVVPTCFALDFSRWEGRLVREGGFSASEVLRLREALRGITVGALRRNSDDLLSLGELERRFEDLRDSALPPLQKAGALLQDCRNHGTLPFAHLARNAFVAMALLRSAVQVGVLTEVEMEDFLATITTVSHLLLTDAQKCAVEMMDWEAFVSRYGHLRPGTYDITSPSYRNDPERYLRPLVDKAAKSGDALLPQTSDTGRLRRPALGRMAAALNDCGLACRPDELDSFLRDAIEGRESAKFLFSRNLSLALDELIAWGGACGLPPDSLQHIDINELFELSAAGAAPDALARVVAQAHANAVLHESVMAVELPPMLCSRSDFAAFLHAAAQPNYIGSGQVCAACVDLGSAGVDARLEGRIAMIPQADPGYDWLFGRDIVGLITMYGGANSHMAIRAAEFGLPAAIGVGELRYRSLTTARELDLNPGKRMIRMVQ